MGKPCLVLRICREEFAVEVRGQDDTSGCLWVLRSDYIGETLHPIRRGVVERVLLDVPVELLHRVDNVVPDHGIVVCVRRSGYEYARQMRRRVVWVDIAYRVGGRDKRSYSFRGQWSEVTRAELSGMAADREDGQAQQSQSPQPKRIPQPPTARAWGVDQHRGEDTGEARKPSLRRRGDHKIGLLRATVHPSNT